MIEDGDRIAVGVSGGADSLFLLWILTQRLPRIPIHYDLVALHVDPGFEGGFGEALQAHALDQGHRLQLVGSDCGVKAHSPENRENPCFLCSRLKRKRLFEVAVENGCNKLALGHNRDDIIETLFINICYAGEISTMKPVQPFFNGEITLIRPLAFSDEPDIRRFAREAHFPDFSNPCPSAGRTKRQEIKTLLNQLYRRNRKVKGNIFRSMSHVRTDYLLTPEATPALDGQRPK